jgi:hypothetical protein
MRLNKSARNNKRALAISEKVCNHRERLAWLAQLIEKKSDLKGVGLEPVTSVEIAERRSVVL